MASKSYAHTGRLQMMASVTLLFAEVVMASIVQASSCMSAAPSFILPGKQGEKEWAGGKTKSTNTFRNILHGRGNGFKADGFGEACLNTFAKWRAQRR